MGQRRGLPVLDLEHIAADAPTKMLGTLLRALSGPLIEATRTLRDSEVMVSAAAMVMSTRAKQDDRTGLEAQDGPLSSCLTRRVHVAPRDFEESSQEYRKCRLGGSPGWWMQVVSDTA